MTPDDFNARAKAEANKLTSRCLLPKEGRSVPSCHENDFCGCEVRNSFLNGAHWGRAQGLNDAANISVSHAIENGPTHDFKSGGHKIAGKIRALIEKGTG